MKYLCIYTPIIPDDTMPSAIHPTSENRAWRQRQIFKMFCTQFDLDKKQYQIEMYKSPKKAQPKKYSVKERWCSAIRKLAIKHNYHVKGRYDIWSLYEEPAFGGYETYELYPIAFPSLVKIVNSIVLSERKDHMYDVIASFLHDNDFPMPNMESRKLYMKTLFGGMHGVAHRIAKQVLDNSANKRSGVPEMFWRYLNMKFHFWNSLGIINIVLAKMKDLGGSTQLVQAVLPRSCSIPSNIRKGGKSENADPFAA